MQERMNHAKRFRDRAEECMALAERATSEEARTAYLALAENYLKLAAIDQMTADTAVHFKDIET